METLLPEVIGQVSLFVKKLFYVPVGQLKSIQIRYGFIKVSNHVHSPKRRQLGTRI